MNRALNHMTAARKPWRAKQVKIPAFLLVEKGKRDKCKIQPASRAMDTAHSFKIFHVFIWERARGGWGSVGEPSGRVEGRRSTDWAMQWSPEWDESWQTYYFSINQTQSYSCLHLCLSITACIPSSTLYFYGNFHLIRLTREHPKNPCIRPKRDL